MTAGNERKPRVYRPNGCLGEALLRLVQLIVMLCAVASIGGLGILIENEVNPENSIVSGESKGSTVKNDSLKYKVFAVLSSFSYICIGVCVVLAELRFRAFLNRAHFAATFLGRASLQLFLGLEVLKQAEDLKTLGLEAHWVHDVAVYVGWATVGAGLATLVLHGLYVGEEKSAFRGTKPARITAILLLALLAGGVPYLAITQGWTSAAVPPSRTATLTLPPPNSTTATLTLSLDLATDEPISEPPVLLTDVPDPVDNTTEPATDTLVPPTPEPTPLPTPATPEPTLVPVTLEPNTTFQPTPMPTPEPTSVQTPTPSLAPGATWVPTAQPTVSPSLVPGTTAVPTPIPTQPGTAEPDSQTQAPTLVPGTTAVPTPVPTPEPTLEPTPAPILAPNETAAPTLEPNATAEPAQPTPGPKIEPTLSPGTTAEPTTAPTPLPTQGPTSTPTTLQPGTTSAPTPVPTPKSTPVPTLAPTLAPNETWAPTVQPTPVPVTDAPTLEPGTTAAPTPTPTAMSTPVPTPSPVSTLVPDTGTEQPTAAPTPAPTLEPGTPAEPITDPTLTPTLLQNETQVPEANESTATPTDIPATAEPAVSTPTPTAVPSANKTTAVPDPDVLPQTPVPGTPVPPLPTGDTATLTLVVEDSGGGGGGGVATAVGVVITFLCLFCSCFIAWKAVDWKQQQTRNKKFPLESIGYDPSLEVPDEGYITDEELAMFNEMMTTCPSCYMPVAECDELCSACKQSLSPEPKVSGFAFAVQRTKYAFESVKKSVEAAH